MPKAETTKRVKALKVNFCLYPSTIEKAKKLSDIQDRSVSSLIRVLIEQAYSSLKGEE